MTTEDTENTERENDLQCELAAWELLREARELLASAKITRDHIIKREIEMQKERDEAWEENAKLHKIAERAIDDLAWFNYSNAQRLRAELNQLKEGAK